MLGDPASLEESGRGLLAYVSVFSAWLGLTGDTRTWSVYRGCFLLFPRPRGLRILRSILAMFTARVLGYKAVAVMPTGTWLP